MNKGYVDQVVIVAISKIVDDSTLVDIGIPQQNQIINGIRCSIQIPLLNKQLIRASSYNFESKCLRASQPFSFDGPVTAGVTPLRVIQQQWGKQSEFLLQTWGEWFYKELKAPNKSGGE